MKRIKGLFGLGAAVAAALTLGACSQDETAGGNGALSPMELTATGLESMVTPMTRATVDGNWEGVSKVAVQVGSEVKEYTVAPDGTTTGAATLTRDTDPFYWPASGDVTVSAWWPYNEADITTKPAVVVKSDQSGEADYAASDFIEAVDQSVTKGDPKLVFTHRTAKICVTLKAADGSQLTGAVVSIVVGGQTVVEKCYNENSSNEHLALIAPTAAAELTVKIATGGKNYVYKHTTAVEYEANSQYTFNLKLKGDEVVALSGCTITEWTDKTLVSDGTAEEDPGYTVDAGGMYHVTSAAGLKAWADAVANSFSYSDIECKLENDIEMPDVADGESNWEPVADSDGYFTGIFDGNGHTITGLVVNKTGYNAGFIAKNYGVVRNLTLKDAKITGVSSCVGAVAGTNNNIGTIENCHVTGECVIMGGATGSQVGGVVGYNNGTILACHVAKDCKISGYMQIGGIAGSSSKEITGCYALCTLIGTDLVGGISGYCSDNTSFIACYSKCSYDYDGTSNIGGIVGYDANAAIYSACYWQEDAKCTEGVGSGMNDPEGVNKIEIMHPGNFDLENACVAMNNVLTPMGYEYLENSDDEPLVLRKTNE